VPLASPAVVQGLGGNVDDGQWILTANILPLANVIATNVSHMPRVVANTRAAQRHPVARIILS
jgi:hypothetical protein